MALERQTGRPFAALVEAMCDSSVYASASADRGVQVRQTHMSVVFLLDEVVYKIKKPVDYGFVDYTTLARRRQMCENEVGLNQRLAPSVYLGVVPICRDRLGAVVVDPVKTTDQLVVEYAVKMVRLADDDTLLHAVRQSVVCEEDLAPIVTVIASFHNKVAARSPAIAKFASFEAITFNVEENFAQTSSHLARGLIEAEIFEEVRTRQRKAIIGFVHRPFLSSDWRRASIGFVH